MINAIAQYRANYPLASRRCDAQAGGPRRFEYDGLMRWLIATLMATALLVGCGQASHRSRYERAAVKVVGAFSKHVTVRNVTCSHVHSNAATCSLTDTRGTNYSCNIELGPATYTVNQCLSSRRGGG
jgi:hypothetical protein